MVAEMMLGIMGIALIVVLAIVLSKPKQREMSGAEKVAYETERGRILAQQEMGR